jgi:Holliday junction resolvase RusA-like endonuclease
MPINYGILSWSFSLLELNCLEMLESIRDVLTFISCNRDVSRMNFTFYLAGPVVPKARPRVTQHGTFMPRRYRVWRQFAETEIWRQIEHQGIQQQVPVERATVEVKLTGKHRMTGDADNILGSCLDALVAIKVLKDLLTPRAF